MHKFCAMLFLGTSLLDTGLAYADVSHRPFGQLREHAIELYTIRDPRGLEAQVMTYGATIVSLQAADRHGVRKNVILGFDSAQPYLAGVPYFGATVGRYANRIAGGTFSIGDQHYQLPQNDGRNSLHGGTQGFDKQLWSVDPAPKPGDSSVRFKLVSPAGDQGYPGELTAYVTYRIDGETLSIEYEATTSSATPVNLANHAYFNLSGDPKSSILDHVLVLDADQFTPVDAGLIPTGVRKPVAGTPFDFTRPHAIGERIDADDEQLRRGKGYDHNWVLSATGPALHDAARLSDPKSGRILKIQTTQPGVQFYSGNFLDGKADGGTTFAHRTGLCLETQHFPDSPNRPTFPNTILQPGLVYQEKTVWTFSAQAGR